MQFWGRFIIFRFSVGAIYTADLFSVLISTTPEDIQDKIVVGHGKMQRLLYPYNKSVIYLFILQMTAVNNLQYIIINTFTALMNK